MSEQRARRSRKRSLSFDNDEIFDRIKTFYDEDLSNRDADRDVRLERYAKFRMWTEQKDWPWPGASNIPMSDMMEKSLRSQDTIHNSVMSARPIINANAMQSDNKDNERKIDDLIDYQVFEENNGEEFIGEAADAFINDGVVTVFIPWVHEKREATDMRRFAAIPKEVPTEDFPQILKTLVAKEFPETTPTMVGNKKDGCSL